MSDDFAAVDSGASRTVPQQCSALRKNGFVCIKERPCKIVDMSTSKTGKHGHAKVHLVGIDIFTGKKYEDICPSTHNMNVPVIKRIEYTLLDITEDGFLSLLSAEGNMKEDVKCPGEELGDRLRSDFDDGKELIVMVVAAMGEEQVTQYKESSNKE
eukprot:GCRY01000030.1.p1 GENE.GCRY01000030.1~~GCRY01000030.1.p1  ORF type:complete len:156 (-),score=43.02 GCRY01000030.1:141-608(-)